MKVGLSSKFRAFALAIPLCLLMLCGGQEGRQVSERALLPRIETVAVTSGITVRAGPRLHERAVGTVPFGAEVRVTRIDAKTERIFGRSGTWKHIEYKNQIGWVFGPLLSTPGKNEKLFVEQGYAFSESDYAEARQALGALPRGAGTITLGVECPWSDAMSQHGHCGTIQVSGSRGQPHLRIALEARQGNHDTWRAAADAIHAGALIVFPARCKITSSQMGPHCEDNGCPDIVQSRPCPLIVKYIGSECRAAGSPIADYPLHAEIVSPSF